ncbi:MAG: prepilin-type N-terminal cleavage/methylation domain-containing protein [Planctomycetota bacterium]
MTRRGFTLIEMVSSLFLASVLVAAIASCIALASRAIPNESDPMLAAAAYQRVLVAITDDVRFATSIDISTSNELRIDMPDRDGDSNTDTIVYAWSGTAGAPLTRQQNAETAVAVVSAVDDASFQWASGSSGSVVIAFRVGKTHVATEQRAMNMPAEVADTGGVVADTVDGLASGATGSSFGSGWSGW